MVGIGGNPILWHIMKIYSYYGYHEFIVLCGYKSEVIKEYFVNYYINNSDITVNLKTNNVSVHLNSSEPWEVTMLYTGCSTMTGSRIKKARKFVGGEPFMLTYGDGVSDVNIPELLEAHKQSGKTVTLTAYQPEGRFGALNIGEDGTVINFHEKPKESGAWINAGFFVCQPEIFDYIPDGEDIVFEQEPLRGLSRDGMLNSYKHPGFWHAMDMLRDKIELNNMWNQGRAPWKLWED